MYRTARSTISHEKASPGLEDGALVVLLLRTMTRAVCVPVVRKAASTERPYFLNSQNPSYASEALDRLHYGLLGILVVNARISIRATVLRL